MLYSGRLVGHTTASKKGAAATETPEAATPQYSSAPTPIYSPCLSSPLIQALKCPVEFTAAHHLPHRRRDNVQILTQSPHKISRREARVQRKQGHDLQCNSWTWPEKCLRTSGSPCSEVNNGHLGDVFTTTSRTIINDFSLQTGKVSSTLYSLGR